MIGLPAYSVSKVLGWGLESIEELDLAGCDLGGDGAMLFANLASDMGEHFENWKQPPPLNHAQLRTLSLRNTNIMDEGLQIILNAANFESLTSLDVSQCRLQDPVSVKLLTNLNLRELDLSGNNNLDLGKLAGWSGLQNLQSLALPQSIKPTTFSKLLNSSSSALRSLDLASGKALAQELGVIAKGAERLQAINLGTTRLGDQAFAELLGIENFASMVHLKSNGCSLSDKAIDALVASKLARLVTLDLSSNKLTDVALAKLAEWDGIKHVTNFRIGNNRKITEAGYASLIASEMFQPVCLDIGKVKDEKIAAPLKEKFQDAVTYSI